MRKLIAGMQSSLDGRIGGADGYADWVEAWSDHYDVSSRTDACLLGAGMYPGYEQYWSAVQNAPDQPLPMTGKLPTPGEIEYAQFAAKTPHYVLSSTLSSAAWPKTQFVHDLEEVRSMKQRQGKDIYLIGGARMVASLLDAGLVDELNLDIYPLLAGPGTGLFATTQHRRQFELRNVRQLPGGRVSLTYAVSS